MREQRDDGTWRIMEAPEADRVARANSFMYAEQFIKIFPDNTLVLDDALRVKELEEDFL